MKLLNAQDQRQIRWPMQSNQTPPSTRQMCHIGAMAVHMTPHQQYCSELSSVFKDQLNL